jgi:hypothetical protein
MLAKLQAFLAAAGVALAFIAGAFLYGRSEGHANAKAEQAKRDAKAAKKARGVEDEINKMGGADIDAALSKWMRDGGR